MSISKNGWVWTDERRKHVKAQWQAGMTFLAIAKSLGDQVTVGMIAGLIDRMGCKKHIKNHVDPGVTLANIGPNDCRFPLGKENDAPEFFCGQPVQEHSPYCPEHNSRCYNRAEPMKVKAFRRFQ